MGMIASLNDTHWQHAKLADLGHESYLEPGILPDDETGVSIQ